MATSIYISNENIDIVTGGTRGKKVIVSDMIKIPINEGSIINGLIMDENEIYEKLRQAYQDNPRLGKRVRLTVDSGSIYTKFLTLPRISPSKLTRIVKESFSELENYQDLLYDFMTIEQPKDKKEGVRALACAVERELLESYIEIFKKLGIKISKINIALGTAISLISKISELSDKTFVVTILDKNNITNILFVNGVYSYINRQRLMEERGTEQSFSEIYSVLSSLVQFNISEHKTDRIEDFYFGGLTDAEKPLAEMIEEEMGINTSKFSTYGSVVFKNGMGSDVAEHFYSIGNLI